MQKMLSDMIMLATHAHEGQFDRGGKPYILHPLAVMHMLNSDDEELMCIAVGHDLLEDTSLTSTDLYEHGFSVRVVKGIQALTRYSFETYTMYKSKVFSNRDAMLVKLCDLRHNSDITRLNGVSEKNLARVAKYHQFYFEIKEKLG